MTRATIIINPISGSGLRGRVAAACALARSTLAGHGLDPDIYVTTGPGDAARRAREAAAAGAGLVIAWGGDGTINEVGSALAFGRVPLAIVPSGSGNGLARELGPPASPAEALAVAVSGHERAIDAGEISGNLFFNVAGIGLDAAIAARFAARPAARRGAFGYFLLTTRALLTGRAQRYVVHLNTETLERRALLIALANSRQYGNGALIAPAARLDDGRLDLVIVEDQSLARIVWRLPALFRGTLSDSPGLTMRTFVNAELRGETPMTFHVDGEPRPAAESLSVRTRPGALMVRCATGR